MPELSTDNVGRELLNRASVLQEELALQEPIEVLEQIHQFLQEHSHAFNACSNRMLIQILEIIGVQSESALQRLRLSFKQASVPLNPRARRQFAALLDSVELTETLFKLELRIARHHQRQYADQSPCDQASILSLKARMACQGAHLSVLHRARTHAAGLLILDCFQAYAVVPGWLYRHLHQVVRQARSDLLEDSPGGWQAVRASYLAILMLAMVNPYALKAEDMEVMLECLRRVSGFVRLRAQAADTMGRYLDMSGQIAPHVAISKGHKAGQRVFVDIEGLFSYKAQHEVSQECRDQLEHFVKRLQLFIKTRPPRTRFSDAADSLPLVWMTPGFYSAHNQLLQEQARAGVQQQSTRWALSGLDWFGAESNQASHTKKTAPSNKHSPLELNPANVKPAEDLNFEGIPKGEQRPDIALNQPQTWILRDISTTGVRAHWGQQSKCRIEVGDLALITADETTADQIEEPYLGIVRWLQQTVDASGGLDTGIQHFEGRWYASFAYPVGARMGQAESWPVFVQRIGAAVSALIVPTAEDISGAVLNLVEHNGDEVKIKLGKAEEKDANYQLMEVERG